MKKGIYFSYAYTISKDISDAIKDTLAELGVDVTFYQKGTEYSDLPIRKCDAFVVNLTNNSTEAVFNTLSPGVQKELLLAVSLKKDIILARVEDGKTQLYIAEVNNKDRKIQAIVGSDAVKLLQDPVKVKEVNTELDWLKTPQEDIIL
jgi:hypothetical protein